MSADLSEEGNEKGCLGRHVEGGVFEDFEDDEGGEWLIDTGFPSGHDDHHDAGNAST